MPSKYVEYQREYEKQFQRAIKLKINSKTEPELLEWLLRQENMQGYIKRLIREDMKREKRQEKE